MAALRISPAAADSPADLEASRPYCAQRGVCCCCQLPRYARCSICLLAVYLGFMPAAYLAGHFMVYPGSDWVTSFEHSRCREFTITGQTSHPIRAAHCPIGLWAKNTRTTPVVAFGGNAMNMYVVLASMAVILPTSERAYDVFSISFPGSQYAPSDGWTTEGRAEREAADLLRYVYNLTGTPVIVYGWSLGTSVASSLAATQSDAIQCVLLGNPFTSIRDVALWRTYNFAWPYLYLLDEWPTARYAEQFRNPTIVMSATQDEIVPPRMHRLVYEKIPSTKALVELPLDHNDIAGFEDAVKSDILDWCTAATIP